LICYHQRSYPIYFYFSTLQNTNKAHIYKTTLYFIKNFNRLYIYSLDLDLIKIIFSCFLILMPIIMHSPSLKISFCNSLFNIFCISNNLLLFDPISINELKIIYQLKYSTFKAVIIHKISSLIT
jgi:hypothetical protein